VANSVAMAVGEGLAPLPFNHPVKITIEYGPGHKIVLKGNTLRVFWQEYVALLQMQQTINEGGPIITSEDLRAVLSNSNEDDEDNEE